MKKAYRKIQAIGLIVLAWLLVIGGNPVASATAIMPDTIITDDPDIWSPTPTPAPVSAENLIKMVNRERISHGLKALVVDPILMQTAQTTADIMAGGLMHGHIGDVRGRVAAAGYGAGDLPWATENFVVLPLGAGSRILVAWADESHQIPMVDPNYCHVGAGVAVVDDTVYYVLHAGYTSNKIYKPGEAGTQSAAINFSVSEYMSPVYTVTPRPDEKIVHVVKPGQTLWGIAIAYNTHIKDIQLANNLPQSLEMVFNGQELVIPIEAPAGPQPEPGITPTLTQMVVPTEKPTSAAPVVVQTPIPPEDSSPGHAPPDPENPDGAKDFLQYGIAGGIATGLFLILVGILSGNKKSRGKEPPGPGEDD